MPRFEVTQGAIVAEFEAPDEMGAIQAFVEALGYATVEDMAAICGKTVDALLDKIIVRRIAESQ